MKQEQQQQQQQQQQMFLQQYKLMQQQLSEVQLQALNIDGFRLVSNFSRSHSTSGRSCIFVRNTIETKVSIILET